MEESRLFGREKSVKLEVADFNGDGHPNVLLYWLGEYPKEAMTS